MSLYKAILKSIRINLSRKDQRKGLLIIALMVLNALLDFFSVAAFLPLFAVVIDPEFASRNHFISKLYIFLGSPSHATFGISIALGILFFVFIKNLISLWIANTKVRYVFNLRSKLSSQALMQYIQSSFLDFTKADFTQQLNMVTSHPLAFSNNIILSITTIISEILVSMLIFGCVLFFDFKVLLLIVLILLPIFIILRIRKKSMQKISTELKTTYPAMLKYTNQMIEGFVEMNTYNKSSYFYKRFQKISERLTEIFIKDQTMQAGTLRLTEIIVAVVMCSLIIYAIGSNMPYQQTLILLGIYAGASFRIVPSINRILHALQQIRTNEFLLEEFRVQQQSPAGIDTIEHDIVFANAIALHNVSFQYPDGPSTLHGIALTINKGQKVAITGGSGEGKTTLLLILLRLLKQTEGELLIDGKPIIDTAAWHKLIGNVPQNPYILDGTVSENIAFGIPPEQIDKSKVLQLINDLALNDLIQHLPNGIDTRIGEHGAKLSGGQRQRLAIARALYADVDILLLDEVTNQVQGGLELEIMSLLNDLAVKNKTIIMVTHKIVDAKFFDAIFKLEKGELTKVFL